jgi:hypothetical protein
MKWTRKRGWLMAIAVVLVLFVVGIVAFQFSRLSRRGDPYRPPQVSFEGTSADLRQTVVVPTLDTPIPAGKNVVWCGSLQIAWNRLRDDLLHSPPSIASAAAVVSRLNQAALTEQDLPEDSFLAVAGLAKDGIVKRIQGQMRERFHRDVQFDDMPGDTVALLYSYLQTQVKFTIPFFENEKTFFFKGSQDHETLVSSFGIRPEDDYAYDHLREQVEVLYAAGRDGQSTDKPDQYVVDLCRDSAPNQIVLACVHPKETLAEILKDVEEKTSNPPPYMPDSLTRRDVVLVPNMNWAVDHRFAELEGKDKRFLNQGFQGWYFDTVRQTIRFKLDRSGAELASESKAYVKPSQTFYVFDRPFLIYIKKRDAHQPFFVMWVDNAELLSKPQ